MVLFQEYGIFSLTLQLNTTPCSLQICVAHCPSLQFGGYKFRVEKTFDCHIEQIISYKRFHLSFDLHHHRALDETRTVTVTGSFAGMFLKF